MTKAWEKLYFLGLTILGLILLYLGMLDLHRRHQPPLNEHLYIDQVYKGKK